MDVTAETTIARPRDEVAAYVADARNDPVWIGGISQVEVLDERRVRRVASFLGKRIDYVNEIVAHEPGVRLEMRTVSGPFPMHIVYAFADAPGGATRFTNRVRGDATGFFRLAAPVMSRAVRRSIQQDADRLRDVLERR